MKNLAAIFLFILLLLNMIGYRVIFFYAQQQSDKQLEASLDKDQYNESDLVTINVPLSLPYQNEQTDFQRIDGEITVNGKIYKYVKRKIADGKLILLCLPDYNKMRLKREKDDVCKDANSLAQSSNSKKQENSKDISYKNVLSEYDQLHYTSITALLEEQISDCISKDETLPPTAPHSSPEQPPEFS